ncbi:hypothetical protein CHS0354_003858 [Potamilus streckersoni]|uniref:MAM domain-containing protein n=1 Tax=Potamilus streckersoni TaxID=2493646 RepID=A0AAE0VV58_9BIVA|nr:hypothetical protein CHS0354_003858 [Potamilus streckersoni]
MRNWMRIYLFCASFGSFVWYGVSVTCTFDDGLCSWAQVTFDDFDWTLPSGSTSTNNNGRDNGHSTENDIYYLYIDASQQKSGDKAILRHRWLYGPGRACLSFWYSMFGISMGTLRVNVRLKNETLLPVWSKTGNQGKGWIFSTLDLEVGPEISIEFEAIRGSGGTSDIALDDVSLTSRSCFDCTFDGDTCHWKLDESWKLSLDEGNGGNYIHSAVSSQCTWNSGLSFVAPFFAMPGSFCFRFLYFLKGLDTASLLLYSYTLFNKSLIWKVSGSTNNSWSLVSIFLEKRFHNFTLEFKMYPSDCMGQAGLDNISVEIGQCQKSSTAVPSTTGQTIGPTVPSTTGQTNGPTVKIELASAGLIVGLVVGAVVFVIVLAIVAVCLYSKRCSSDKNNKHIGLHSYSHDSARNKGNRRDHSREELTINSCYYTSSPDILSPNNEIVGNINATTDNIEYASICKPTNHAHRTDDMYDHASEEKMPQFQSTYDHVAANSFEEYDKTYSMTKDKPDVCGTYEDVTMGFDDAYDKTYERTGEKSDPDKTYDHVTSITSETYVTT